MLFLPVRTPEENVKELHEKVLAAHVKIVHLDTLQKTESGLYIPSYNRWVGKHRFCYGFYTGDHKDLQYRHKCQYRRSGGAAAGAFSCENAYIPLQWPMGAYSILRGLEEMLLVMREGEIRRIWLPYWLSNYTEGEY